MAKRIWLVLSLLGIMSIAAFCAVVTAAKDAKPAQTAATPSSEPAQAQPGNYTVVKGDTLWGIAGRMYNDPYLWPKLWQVNKGSIKDPNLILTAQVISAPDKSQLKDVEAAVPPASQALVAKTKEKPAPAVAGGETMKLAQAAEPVQAQDEKIAENEQEDEVSAPAEQAKVPETAQAEVVTPVVSVQQGQSQPAVTEEEDSDKQYIGSESMVVPRDWTVDGVIAGEKDKKLMISAGDTVYINLGSDKVCAGTRCQVYRKIGKVKDPGEQGAYLGSEVRRVGKIEVTTDIGKDVSTAKVIVSYEPIEVGDGVKIIFSEE